MALEVLKGIKTIQEIAKEFDVHPTQVSDWKKTMAKNAASAFGAGAGGTDADEFERERARLELNPSEVIHRITGWARDVLRARLFRVAGSFMVYRTKIRHGFQLGALCF